MGYYNTFLPEEEQDATIDLIVVSLDSENSSPESDVDYIEEYVILRQTVPYLPPDMTILRNPENMDYFFYTSSKEKELANFIGHVTGTYVLHNSFSQPTEIDKDFLLNVCLLNTSCVSWYEEGKYPDRFDTSGPLNYPQLIPFAKNGKYYGCLEEHVEATSALLFGGNLIEHQTSFMYDYLPKEGIYVSKGMDCPQGFHMPVILQYQETDEFYEITTVFIDKYFMGDSMRYIDDEYRELSYDEAMRYCQEVLARHHIQLQKQEDGSIVYYSHILPTN